MVGRVVRVCAMTFLYVLVTAGALKTSPLIRPLTLAHQRLDGSVRQHAIDVELA
jgi:hypothetical protein